MAEFTFEKQTIKLDLPTEAEKSVFNEIFRFREYRVAEGVIKKATEPILDVGAHWGFFSIYCRLLNESVPIYAIEPEPKNCRQIARNIKENKFKGIKVVESVLQSITEERALYLAEDSHNHSLLQSNNSQKSVLVPGISFSDFCKKNKVKIFSLLKMDIEGGEYEILENFSKNEFQLIKHIIMEYHDIKALKLHHGAIEKKLRESGFSVEIFPSRFDKSMGIIFAKNKKI